MSRRPLKPKDTKVLVEELFSQFLDALQIADPNPELDLQRTPARIARMYVDELLVGYDDKALAALDKTFTVFNASHTHEMVIIRNTSFVSLCGHHLMPFYGAVDFGYIPKGQVVGLSKFPRAVRLFSARLQTQELLTKQLADFVWHRCRPLSLIVRTTAHHLCCSARGIREPNVQMVTTALRGTVSPDVKQEFYRNLS